MPHKTINGRMPPAGFSQSATVPALMRNTSTILIAMMTVRLLSRSAKVPPTNDNNINGKVKMMKVIAVWVCAAVSSSGPGTICAVACRMASKATISFHALSLNAPQNCAIKSPRRGCADVFAMEGCKDQSLVGTTMLKKLEKIKGNNEVVW